MDHTTICTQVSLIKEGLRNAKVNIIIDIKKMNKIIMKQGQHALRLYIYMMIIIFSYSKIPKGYIPIGRAPSTIRASKLSVVS